MEGLGAKEPGAAADLMEVALDPNFAGTVSRLAAHLVVVLVAGQFAA